MASRRAAAGAAAGLNAPQGSRPAEDGGQAPGEDGGHVHRRQDGGVQVRGAVRVVVWVRRGVGVVVVRGGGEEAAAAVVVIEPVAGEVDEGPEEEPQAPGPQAGPRRPLPIASCHLHRRNIAWRGGRAQAWIPPVASWTMGPCGRS